MSSIGTGYDLSVTTFSPDGRVFQVEYATKAVDNSGTVVGIKCKDGIVLGVEKLVTSKMILEGSNRRIHSVYHHSGLAVAGLAADGRQIVSRAKSEAASYEKVYGEPISVKDLADRVASYVHLCTLYWWLRPFGCGVILGGYDRDGPQLYMIEPSGVSYGLRSREEEDKVSSYFLLKAIADTCRVSATIQSDIHEPEIPEESMEQFDEDQELQQIINGQVCMKVYNFAAPVENNFNRKIILPGSFNPLHDGHLRLLEVASSMCDDGLPFFEISAINADKPPLSIAEIKRRVEQFRKAGKNVIISNQPYFYKKAELFPGSAFIIGADTAARLVNPKYYGGDYNRMLEILLECKSTGTTFLVGGRKIEGDFKVLEDLDIPEELRDMFISIPEEKFRIDISSTEIRKSQGL